MRNHIFISYSHKDTRWLKMLQTIILTSSAGLDKVTFVQDETLKRAYVRSIEVIGEAIKQIPDHSAKNTRRSNGVLSVACAIA
jgi:uncharacterized protein with HEPN domain